jgi:hypothetical protein
MTPLTLEPFVPHRAYRRGRTVVAKRSGERFRALPLVYGAYLLICWGCGSRQYYRHNPTTGRVTAWTREEAARYSRKFVNQG